MITFTGRRIDPWNIKANDIFIEDIAHHLSNLCRFTGATRKFYSVAQHCLRVSQLVDPVIALPALLHDAAEAYYNDLSTELKYSHPLDMQFYRDNEKRTQGIIFERFGVSSDFTHSTDIKAADIKACDEEKSYLLPPHKGVYINCMGSEEAETQYLRRFKILIQLWNEDHPRQ